MCCYRPPTKFRESNVFSLSLFTGGGESYVAIAHDALDLTIHPLPSPDLDMFKFVQLGLIIQGPHPQPCPPPVQLASE